MFSKEPSLQVPALTRAHVRDEWIDANDHMNSAMYFVAVRDAVTALFHSAGMHADYVAKTGCSLVQREAHIRYVRELRRAEPILMRSWVAAMDSRSVHVVTELRHGELDWVAATVEVLYTYFDRGLRRSTAWPAVMRQALSAIAAAGAASLPSEAVGRRVAVRDG
jgi:acyl-CoA thioester hydrolase